MWTLSNVDLPVIANSSDIQGIPLATIDNPDLPNEFAPIAIVYSSEYFESLINTTTPIVSVVSDATVITLTPEEFPLVTSVTTSGQTFVQGDSPGTLTEGQFFYDSINGTLTVQGGTNYLLDVGNTLTINSISELIDTDIVQEDLPEFFRLIPIMGTFGWSRSLEQHPTAQLDMMIDAPKIALARNVFRVGAEYTIFGIGYRITNTSDVELSLDEYPGGVFQVSVTFQGKWAYYAGLPAKLKNGRGFSIFPIGQDPECQVQVSTGSFSDVSIFNVNPLIPRVTVQSLAEQVGAKVIGPEMLVKVPSDTPLNASTSFDSELNKHTRIQEGFAFYSDASAVRLKRFDDVARHTVEVGDILTEVQNTYQGNPKPSFSTLVSLLPNPFDYSGNLPSTVLSVPSFTVQAEDLSFVSAPFYNNVQVTGRFSEIGGGGGIAPDSSPDSQRPRYRRIPPKRQQLQEGDPDVFLPPLSTQLPLKTLSLNWDSGGTLKTLRTSITEDGSPIEDRVETWGWVYSGLNSSDAFGEIRFSPTWRKVREEITTYEYSSEGWLLSVTTTGWDFRRFRQESESLETLLFSSATDIAYRRLYIPFRLSLYSVTKYFLAAYALYYPNEDFSGAYESFKQCNRSGTSSIEYVPNPNYVVPLFVLEEQKQVNSFASVPDPDASPDNPLPYITTGEESFYSRYVVIGENISLSPENERSDAPRPKEWYREYVSNQSASDGNFKNSTALVQFKEYEGRPSTAQRKQVTFERVEPDNDDSNYVVPKLDYFLTTPGYTSNPGDPVNGSVSYEVARTETEAITAAKTDLKMRDIQESVDTSVSIKYSPQIKEGDFVRLITQFYSYNRYVKSVSHSIQFEGEDENGNPLVVGGKTQLSLGIDRDIPVTITRRAPPGLPGATSNPPSPGIPPRPPGRLRLGELIESSLETRRKF